MIEHDRDLLARLARVNKHLGAATLELLEYQDGGELPAATSGNTSPNSEPTSSPERQNSTAAPSTASSLTRSPDPRSAHREPRS